MVVILKRANQFLRIEYLMNMKVILLGASGQLGRAWQDFFKGDTDTSAVLLPFTSQQLDITEEGSAASELERHQPDLVINCAAYTAVDRAESEKEKARAVNVDAVTGLARLCRDRDVKLLHFSTDYVFSGKKGDRKKFPNGYPEDHPADPVNWYGQTKWEGEEAIRASGCRHLIIRTTWLCGKYGSNFVKTMVRLGCENKSVKVVNDQWGSPSFADEVVANTMKLIEAKAEGTFHLTSKGLTNWAGFAEAIFEMADLEVRVEPVPSEEYPTDARRPRYSKLDTSKAEAVAGVSITPWETGLERLIGQL